MKGFLILARPGDKLLITNSFKLHDEMGVTLDLQLDIQKERGNMIISCVDFMLDAMKAGWTEQTAMRVIEGAFMDVYGKMPKGLI